MEIGTSIALSSSILGIVAIIFKLFDNKQKSSGGHCPDHSGICSNINTLQEWLERIEVKLDRVIEKGIGK